MIGLRSLLILIAAISTLVVTSWAATQSPRQHLLLDANWKFHLGDEWPEALHLESSGTGAGPASEGFDDTFWRTVDLPHDWAIELPFDAAADGGHGFKALGAKYQANSIGWYRRTLTLTEADKGKRIWLTFDGVFRDASVWVNGWFVRHHESGYYPFREDITDLVRFGKGNTIAVRVDATKPEGWFYEGAGIYRHVWLDKTAPIAIAPNGVFVRTLFEKNVPNNHPTIVVEARLLNSTGSGSKVTVRGQIVSPEGKEIGAFSKTASLARQSAGIVNLTSKIASPIFWSPESPKLYELVTTVSTGGVVVDRQRTAFGIRTVGFDPNRGFLLNGKPYVLHGTCNHQDHAGVGAAMPDALQEFRVRRLKDFGCNAYRTSHNPPTPELLDACDRLGMLVMDESRLMGSDSENMTKLDENIRRDRNHPCVAIWNIANEQFFVQDTPQAANVARTMQDYIKRLDGTRPVTYAAPEGNTYRGVNSVIEVRGWNYHYGPEMDRYHAEHPFQPNVGTEQASVVGTRGIYTNDSKRGYVSAYDVVWPGWTTTAESWWSFFADRPWLSGGFVWTGFDYRGEPTPYWWPCINSHFGILDTCGFPKDAFYYYKSWWTAAPVLHVLPHWNWPGREGQSVLVEVFSNCPQVELFLNGRSLGRKRMKANSKLSWEVIYAPGTLSAKGFDGAGKIIGESKVETTGPAVRLQLTPDRETIAADGEDISVFTVSALDAEGRAVPVAQNNVHFNIEGAGSILGVGNGDPSSHEPDTYLPTLPSREIPVLDWRWQRMPISKNKTSLPEYANDFTDSSWAALRAQAGGNESTIKTANTSAVYRSHLVLSEKDLKADRALACFSGCDDEGWYFVNGHFVGESHDWQARPVFDIRPFLHAGDNVIAVGVNNLYGEGGLNPNVTVRLLGKVVAPQWSRSLFNGLAQVIVRSTHAAGSFRLTATTDELKPATATVKTTPRARRPFVP
ncbi:beta-galactosidase GalA [Fimbriimonas ginsengisoli]|uniref:Glycoside hydrolase family protein n=1 Tax=Fimbriimonas ginsengisoli Gsoil 348 TaxID=661478 RepID=A0A068NLN9_FIMGI|nr:beta-galactosidase GalA [Fimbriimonas ginsengisoli]AIE83675.1 glycoside hydrolase family protein [Fimbriimonas ginsengisoli Gsoil 348]